MHPFLNKICDKHIAIINNSNNRTYITRKMCDIDIATINNTTNSYYLCLEHIDMCNIQVKHG